MTETKLTTSVWTPAGAVVKNEILQAAIRSVRDDLPPAAAVKAVLVSCERKPLDGQAGREYIVDVLYTPRGKQDDAVDLDEHLEALETPVFDPRDVGGDYG
jgi:hypothetical protein